MAFNSNNNYNVGDARAPYNFVPLNDKVVVPPLGKILSNCDQKDYSNVYAEYLQAKGTYSGYFEVELTNMTPFYIGGQNGFFSDGKNVCIPGSSIRGCIKNLFKIITSSAFRGGKENPDLKDKHLYFRSFAATGGSDDFKKNYSDRMVGSAINAKGKRVGVSKAKPGFIVKENNNYFICPAEYSRERIRGFEDCERVYWKNDCAEVHTGRMRNKKHYYRIFNPHWNTKLVIDEEIINDYLDDTTRRSRLNVIKSNVRLNRSMAILRGANKYSYIHPCFYVADAKGNVQHFGSGPYYRIPYIKSTGDHIPAAIRSDEIIDFADAVFGRKEDWASRLIFEDLYLEKAPQLYKEEFHKVLGTPNPTSFQLYLENNPTNGRAETWEGSSNIRGYKLYWHTNMDWSTPNGNPKMSKTIAPLKPNHTFKGRVRFENLDEQELGALCYVMALAKEKDICYKLGMGKSIGMGSVKIDAKLLLQQDNYYVTLFDDNGFAECVKEADLSTYKQVFDDYVKQELTGKSYALYQERMRELRMILSIANINNPKWNKVVEKLDFLGKGPDKEIASKRRPLPSITQVFNKVQR